MWLKRLFGLRDSEPEFDPLEEPARVPTPAAHLRPSAQSDSRRRVELGSSATDEAATPQPQPKPQTGFDPYNSGTFKKQNNAWERVSRR